MDKIYAINHFKIFEKIVKKKREEIASLINELIKDKNIEDALDIGTTSDSELDSSNLITKKINNVKKFKSVSIQEVDKKKFFRSVKKSITSNFSNNEINELKSDLVIASAIIEHVGDFNNQLKMCKNIIELTKKIFVITTPNKFHPIEFHTKIPFMHWLPDKIYRKFLSLIGIDFLSKEENLNLLNINNLIDLMEKNNFYNYKIFNIRLFFIKSNFILVGFKK